MTGRPTSFNESMLEIADHYVTEGYKEKGQALPTVAGLALDLNVARSTIFKWCEDKDHPFSDYLEKCNAIQELELVNKGLDGTFNSTVAKLILGRHGYSDKVVSDVNVGIDVSSRSLEELEYYQQHGRFPE